MNIFLQPDRNSVQGFWFILVFGVDTDGNHVGNSACYKDDDAEDLGPGPDYVQVILIKCQ